MAASRDKSLNGQSLLAGFAAGGVAALLLWMLIGIVVWLVRLFPFTAGHLAAWFPPELDSMTLLRHQWWPGFVSGVGATWGLIAINWAIDKWDDAKGH